MSWTIVRSGQFKRGYKRKSPKLQAVVDEAIRTLVTSEDPREHGRRKYGSLNGTYGHDLDSRNRLLYALDLVKKELFFLRVCTHKQVYGK